MFIERFGLAINSTVCLGVNLRFIQHFHSCTPINVFKINIKMLFSIRSVFGGPMKVHPDTVVPIRQPKGPDMAKNFATRIRRKAASKLLAAAAERRSKSANDRRKSAMF